MSPTSNPPLITVPNRPFSTELFTGMMLPDGFFDAFLGQQQINAHFKNKGNIPVANTNVYVESVSSPAIVVTPQTYSVSLDGGASRLLAWDIDVSAAPAGEYQVSFIAQNASGRTRVIKKFFVTRTQFDPMTGAFSTRTPEGTISVRFLSLFGPQADCCAEPRQRPAEINILQLADRLLKERASGRDTYQFCLPFLLKDMEVAVTMSPPFAGQHSDLPFQDPWWKVLLAVLAFIFLVVCAVIAAVYGKNLSGGVATTASGDPVPVMQGNCGKTDQSVAGLIASLAAAIGSAVGAAQDTRDPFRRGQDQTMPAPGELTTSEHLKMSISYPEPVALGKPFAVGADWEYTRVTTGSSYSYAVSEINYNSHVVSSYQITAPNVVRVYKREPFIVKGEFLGPDGKAFQGDQLFVQCILEGLDTLQGQYRRFIIQDDGNFPDDKPNDGVYTGIHYFTEQDRGFWKIYVFAQDVNNAQPQPDMSPEEAAQIIGGMVLTHQLTVSFEGGTCPLVPDGDVHVI